MSEPFEPEIMVLYCGHTLAGGDRPPEVMKHASGFKARFIMMPCSSKIEPGHLVKLIEQGMDRVTVVACPEANCQFLVGSNRAEGRVRYARILLDEAGMGAERVGIVRKDGLSVADLIGIAEYGAKMVGRLGPSPMKATTKVRDHVEEIPCKR